MPQTIPHQQGNGQGQGQGSGGGQQATGILIDPPVTVTVLPTQNLVVSTVPIDTLKSRKYLIDISSATQEQTYELLAKINSLSAIDYTIYANLGDNINHNIYVNLVLNDIIINIENTHVSNIDVDVRVIR